MKSPFEDKKVCVVYVHSAASPEFSLKIQTMKGHLQDLCTVVDHVDDSDLVLFICDFPDHHAGFATRSLTNGGSKQCLAVAHASSKVSALITTCDRSGFEFRRYNDLREVPGMVMTIFQEKVDAGNGQQIIPGLENTRSMELLQTT